MNVFRLISQLAHADFVGLVHLSLYFLIHNTTVMCDIWNI